MHLKSENHTPAAPSPDHRQPLAPVSFSGAQPARTGGGHRRSLSPPQVCAGVGPVPPFLSSSPPLVATWFHFTCRPAEEPGLPESQLTLSLLTPVKVVGRGVWAQSQGASEPVSLCRASPSSAPLSPGPGALFSMSHPSGGKAPSPNSWDWRSLRM